MRLVLAAALAAIAVAGGQASKAGTFDPDPVFPVGPISGTVSHQIVRLGHVASALAGRRAIVNCWSQPDWTRLEAWRGAHHAPIDVQGLTFPRTRRIQLSPFVCQVLAQTLARSAQQPLYAAFAITVLAHESAHAFGIDAEDLAECRAIRTEPRAAQLLGVPKALAGRLQHIYRGTLYPHEPPQYRVPACKAGQPGLVVPDTLGSSAHLRPLSRIATAVARTLPGWRDVGGGVGPLEPCAPITSRTLEVARFSETLLGPRDESVTPTSAILRTDKAYATALVRYRALPRCDLALRRLQIRESHVAATVSLGRLPDSITRLSSHVRGFRDIYTSHGKTLDLDTIFVFDRPKRTLSTLFFSAVAGRLSSSVELRATAAIIHASR